MEPTIETISLGNNENLRLIKIGSILNKKERKDLKELLIEFEEVFAWSYEDMPGIDPGNSLTSHSHSSHGARKAKVEVYEN